MFVTEKKGSLCFIFIIVDANVILIKKKFCQDHRQKMPMMDRLWQSSPLNELTRWMEKVINRVNGSLVKTVCICTVPCTGK